MGGWRAVVTRIQAGHAGEIQAERTDAPPGAGVQREPAERRREMRVLRESPQERARETRPPGGGHQVSGPAINVRTQSKRSTTWNH